MLLKPRLPSAFFHIKNIRVTPRKNCSFSVSLWVETFSNSCKGLFFKITGVVESLNLPREFFRPVEGILGVEAFAMGLDFDREPLETPVLGDFSEGWFSAREVKRFGTLVEATIVSDSSCGIRFGPIEAVSTLSPFVLMVLLK